jgi:hypothetical protein
MKESTYEPTDTPRTNKRCREIHDARLAAEKTGYACDSPDMTSLAREMEREITQLKYCVEVCQTNLRVENDLQIKLAKRLCDTVNRDATVVAMDSYTRSPLNSKKPAKPCNTLQAVLSTVSQSAR